MTEPLDLRPTDAVSAGADSRPRPRARRARRSSRTATGRRPSDGASVSLADLRTVPLLASLTETNLAQLANAISKRRAPTGEVLCREGELGEQMYVILSGAVSVRKCSEGREIELGQLESGAHFGEMALIGDAPRTATILAATAIEYLAIDRDTLMRVIASFPSVALEILKGYNTRLAETTQRLAQVTARQQPTTTVVDADPEQAYRTAVEKAIADGPYPLATLLRKMRVESGWGRKVLQALDSFEVIVKLTTLALLADYLTQPHRRTEELDQTVVAAFRRPTLGQLIELSGRVLRSYSARLNELFMPELYALYFDGEGGRTAGARALQALLAYRNRLKHGAEGVRDEYGFRVDFEGNSQPRADAGERGSGIKQYLTQLLQEVAFLHDYPLIYLTSMTYEHGTFEYGYERCTGAYPDFDHGVFVWDAPLENKRLYLLRRDGRALALEPLLRRERCPECAHSQIFILFGHTPDRERGVRAEGQSGDATTSRWREKMEYLSYACGHLYADLLPAERIARGEGLQRLLESPSRESPAGAVTPSFGPLVPER
jgi:CRP/FNR family cyclic AMP-dependent transcriptional regulator